jgi:hypothetical protein
MYKLFKAGWGFQFESERVSTLLWNEDNTFKKELVREVAVGGSLFIGRPPLDYWLTTVILEILEEREGFIRFRTENSVYELFSGAEADKVNILTYKPAE